jgi:hypothetical protein
MDEQKQPKRRRPQAAILIMLAIISIAASFTRLHGTPAFLSAAVGALLLVIGIMQLLKKE